MEGHLPPALNVPELGTPACSRALRRQPSPAWHSMGILLVVPQLRLGWRTAGWYVQCLEGCGVSTA